MSGSSNDSPDAKKPCKGILKSSSSFDKHSISAGHRKSAKFDEVNVLQTYHPPDKDYGHMKIEEPKTPFNYSDASLAEQHENLNTTELIEMLNDVAAKSRISISEDESDEEIDETPEEKVKRLEFEKRRKAHYKEFEAVKLARKLIEEELADDDDDGDEELRNQLPPATANPNTMDIDEKNKNL